jgi:hypothetical protein
MSASCGNPGLLNVEERSIGGDCLSGDPLRVPISPPTSPYASVSPFFPVRIDPLDDLEMAPGMHKR